MIHSGLLSLPLLLSLKHTPAHTHTLSLIHMDRIQIVDSYLLYKPYHSKGTILSILCMYIVPLSAARENTLKYNLTEMVYSELWYNVILNQNRLWN